MGNPVYDFKKSVQRRQEDDGSKFSLAVSVPRLEKDDLFTEDKFEVQLDTSDHNYHKVSIYWEENGYKHYKNLGLWGFYSTQYQQMEYDPIADVLIIIDSAGEQIIISNK